MFLGLLKNVNESMYHSPEETYFWRIRYEYDIKSEEYVQLRFLTFGTNFRQKLHKFVESLILTFQAHYYTYVAQINHKPIKGPLVPNKLLIWWNWHLWALVLIRLTTLKAHFVPHKKTSYPLWKSLDSLYIHFSL